MDPKQHVYYALGILAYAMAKSDGEIHEEEQKKLHDIVRSETNHLIDFQYTEIIFQLLERDHPSLEGTYQWAINELKKGRHYLSPELKKKMVEVLMQIAAAFNRISPEEFKLIERFQSDLENIGTDHYLK